jgi:hypothetical protein
LTAAIASAGPEPGGLPELARVPWRPRVTERQLDRTGHLWTATTVAHTLPFIAGAVVLVTALPVLAPVAVVLLAHAWAIPELYAARGAAALRQRSRYCVDAEAEHVAAGFLGDLVGDRALELHRRTGVVVEPGTLGVWLLGPAGALLVRPGGRRVNCYCVRVNEPRLPPSDRIAHLLLALRSDETGFVTVANLSFSGARWRVRRRLGGRVREALDAAVRAARPS